MEVLQLRIHQVYEADLLPPFPPSLLWSDDKSYHVEWKDFEADYDYEDNSVRLFSEDVQIQRVRQKCEEFYEAVRLCTDNDHFASLDHAFASLFRCQWRPRAAEHNGIVEETCHYIARLPSFPAELPYDLIASIPDGYFNGVRRSWENLRVVSEHSANAIRCIIMYVLEDRVNAHTGIATRILNNVGQMIDATVQTASTKPATEDKNRAFIVRAFLWKFWQTLRLVFSAHNMLHDIRMGVAVIESTWLRNFDVDDNLSIKAFTETQSEIGKPQNMCSWSLELMRNHPNCLGLDFRLFFQRYRTFLAGFAIRCTKSGSTVCDGKHPHHCLRYRGLSVGDQSTHDENCKYQDTGASHHESKLLWDKASYLAVDGARAVSIQKSGSGRLRYCRASERTIAISHVWIHGQGGRPESGINECLHRRYTSIAESLNCDSYWIDTACIPTNHQLRREAIEHINDVFYASCATIVCDKDIMTIDTSVASTELFEAMLCAMIMCDWNARAWTILEGLKGRKNVYFICKHNRILNTRTLVEHLMYQGSLSIVAFACQIAHVLPRRDWKRSSGIDPSDSLRVEDVGSWLSHRPSSRPGDEVVIWSLLLDRDMKPIFSMRDFWRQQEFVNTGFLLSSAARLTEPGLCWAPESSYIVPNAKTTWFGNDQICFRPMPSATTERAKITEDGITASWFVFEFYRNVLPMFNWLHVQTPTESELNKIRSRFVRPGHFGALLRPVSNETGMSLYIPAKAPKVPGDSREGVLLAVCDSPRAIFSERAVKYRGFHNTGGPRHQSSFKWIWRGVYLWPRDVALPELRGRDFFWIS